MTIPTIGSPSSRPGSPVTELRLFLAGAHVATFVGTALPALTIEDSAQTIPYCKGALRMDEIPLVGLFNEGDRIEVWMTSPERDAQRMFVGTLGHVVVTTNTGQPTTVVFEARGLGCDAHGR